MFKIKYHGLKTLSTKKMKSNSTNANDANDVFIFHFIKETQ